MSVRPNDRWYKAEGVNIDAARLQQMIADVGGSVRGTMSVLEKLVFEAKR